MNEQQIKTAHTPGPWKYFTSLRVLSGRGEELAAVRWDDFYAGDSVTEKPYKDENQALANARLIAAAPDLLAALEQLMAHVEEEWGVEEEGFEGCSMARAAIAKAKGGAS